MTVLVIDIGSSSVRALLFDDNARPVRDAENHLSHSFTYEQDGAVTANPQQLQTRVETCISNLLDQVSKKYKINAVGISSFVGNLMGVDASGNPVTPLYTYADTRSQYLVDSIPLDANTTLQRTGCRLHAAYNTLKLHWLKQTQPHVFSQVTQWLDFASYLYLQWFGEAQTSYSIASWSGLLNREHLSWDDTWLDFLAMTPAQFPALADATDSLQGLRDKYRERWSLLADVPFYPAIGDGAGANIGCGAINNGTIALSVGSTAALRYITDDKLPTVPEGLWGYRVTAQQHLIGGATTEGGTTFAWAEDTLAISDDDMAQLANRPPDNHGLTILPLFAGERSPGWQGDARATIHGIGLSTTALDLLQALLESVALRLATIADKLITSDVRVMASGGAIAASPLWAQIIANAMNQSLYICTGETSARGVAILLLSQLHDSTWEQYPPTITAQLDPQPDAVDILRQARQRQQTLYTRLYS